MQVLKQLQKKHGEYIEVGRDVYFKDGHKITLGIARDNLVVEGFVEHEPVTELEQLENMKVFLTAKLQEEVDAWRKFKHDCLQASAMHARYPQNVPGPRSDSVEQLEAGKERIQALQAKRAEVEQQIVALKDAALTPEQIKQKELRQQFGNRQNAAADNLHKAISSVQLDIELPGIEDRLTFDVSRFA